MRTFDPAELPHQRVHQILLGGVAPRPIALVGSLDSEGTANLAPFSFFNAFGANPPVICFSPAFSGKTGAPKDTLLNILESKECTVSIVTYDMVHQVSLASAPYERHIDEFIKSGLSKLPSQKIKTPGVAESPFVMEAKLLHHIDFGGMPASGNMLICEVVLFHVSNTVFNEKDQIDPRKMDQVARMGGPWYTRAAHGLFELAQPSTIKPGFDDLPEAIRRSPYLSGSNLAKLLDVGAIPSTSDVNVQGLEEEIHLRAKELIENGDIEAAWKILVG